MGRNRKHLRKFSAFVYVVGFSSTVHKLFDAQCAGIERFFQNLLEQAQKPFSMIGNKPVSQIVGLHGDGQGGDVQFHEICEKFGIVVKIAPHATQKKRAKLKAEAIEKPTPFRERNKNLAVQSDILIACPMQMEEIQRCGTWATVRYMQNEKKPVYLILPDGTTPYFSIETPKIPA